MIDEPPEAGDTGLREAVPGDLDLLVPACAAAHEDEIGIDPLVDDLDGFRWRTRAQIGEGRSWLWAENGTILFKAEASAWTPHAVQLQQVWVDPAARGQGFAQRGLRDLCRRLLAQVPRVCLFVRARTRRRFASTRRSACGGRSRIAASSSDGSSVPADARDRDPQRHRVVGGERGC